MRAMVLPAPGRALELRERPLPVPGPHEVLLRVEACGVCRTDLHVADGELPPRGGERVLGHQIVGRVVACGADATRFARGDRVGVAWLGSTCEGCAYCTSGRENLCRAARFTGYDFDGGFADYTCADARYAFALDPALDALHAAPLLCAGLIGYRALRLCGDAQRVGLYGFGAAAHIAAQVLRHQQREVHAFTRAGDAEAQSLALRLGARWAGASHETPPDPLDAAVIFAPAGELVPHALAALAPGGCVVCAGIHMSDIPAFPYRLLWEERSLRSVANLTRRDGEEFLALAARIPVQTTVTAFDLVEANAALAALREGRVAGSLALRCSAEAAGLPSTQTAR